MICPFTDILLIKSAITRAEAAAYESAAAFVCFWGPVMVKYARRLTEDFHGLLFTIYNGCRALAYSQAIRMQCFVRDGVPSGCMCGTA